MTTVPTVPLNTPTGTVPIPQLGFGVWQVPEDEVVPAVAKALEVGYEHIDTAAMYGNESGVGQAVTDSGLGDNVWLTTKLNNNAHGFDLAMKAFDASMDKLQREVLDLYLIHWPLPKTDRYPEAWKAMQALRDDGRITTIGVCNFQIPHLQRLFDETGEFPAINQIELHPFLVQQELRDFHAANGIVTEAWSPLASGGLGVLDDETIVAIARGPRRDSGAGDPAVAPPARQRRHPQVGDAEPDRGELRPVRVRARPTTRSPAITALDRSKRTGPDPDRFNPSRISRSTPRDTVTAVVTENVEADRAGGPARLQPQHVLRRLPRAGPAAVGAAPPQRAAAARRAAVHRPAPDLGAVAQAAPARAALRPVAPHDRRPRAGPQAAGAGQADPGGAHRAVGRPRDADAERVCADPPVPRDQLGVPVVAVPCRRVPARQQERRDGAGVRPRRRGARPARHPAARSRASTTSSSATSRRRGYAVPPSAARPGLDAAAYPRRGAGRTSSARCTRAPAEHWGVYETCEELVDLEDNMQLWRFRHLKVVERHHRPQAGDRRVDAASTSCAGRWT